MPQIAYRIPGSEVIVEAPSTKVVPLNGESGRVELSFYSGSTGKSLEDFISGAKSGETVSYYCYVRLTAASSLTDFAWYRYSILLNEAT